MELFKIGKRVRVTEPTDIQCNRGATQDSFWPD